MSALAGILNFDGAPVGGRALDTLSGSIAKHGPDGGGQKHTANLGITFRAFHTDADSKLERQPLVSSRGHVLAWDGRLDNRHDLLSRLQDTCVTDVEVVMASYVTWGTEFLSHLIGDFALSLWDPATRTLLLARDPFGTRPIYYVATAQRIVWSSELASLIDFASSIEVDDEYIASYLGSVPDVSRTAYKHIRSVQPGVALIVRHKQIERPEFWKPAVGTIRYRHDSEYEEQFRELFREAVRCRLRSDGPVWAELSGGLDSSSIVCMADQIVESGELAAPPVETVSYVYDNSAGSDERRFINDVEQQRLRTGHHFHEDEFVGRYRNLDLTSIVRPNPTFRFTHRHAWVRARMRQTGSRVLLSGVAGDNLLWSGAVVSPQLADLLARFKVRSLHHQVKLWSEVTRRSYGETLWNGAVMPLLPQSLRGRFDSTYPSSLIDSRFANRLRVANESHRPWRITLPSDRIQEEMFSVAIQAVASCYYRDRVVTEYRFPFLHRPLVEFLLAIPIDQKIRPTENRSLQRRALKHLLPETILKRQSKRWPTEALCRTLANNWSEVEWLFQKPRVCEYGFVDASAFAAAAKRIRHGLQNVAGELSLILSIELWLRALDSRRRSPAPSVAEHIDEEQVVFQVAGSAV